MTVILVMFCLFSVLSVSAVQVSENVKFQTPGTNTTFIMGSDFTFDTIEVHSTDLRLNDAVISVCPSAGSIDFTLFSFSTEYRKWTESCSNPDAIADHTMGGLKPNTPYDVKVNGAIYGQYRSNESGYVFFTYSGGYSDIVFELEEAGAPPKPDLIITEKWLCWPDTCTICYNVTNTGTGPAPACHNTTLYVDGVAVAHDHVPVDLAPGESYTGCFNGYVWTYTPPSDNITVCADNNGTLDELDENNNCLTNIWMCGDVNGDGKVTMSDVRKVFNRYLNPSYPLDLPWAADVNCDGKVTMSDVRKVFNRYLDPGYELNCCCEGLE